MPDSMEIIIGRLQQSVEELKQDIADIKKTNAELVEFVNTQKAGQKLIWVLATTIGGIIVFFKDHILYLIHPVTDK